MSHKTKKPEYNRGVAWLTPEQAAKGCVSHYNMEIQKGIQYADDGLRKFVNNYVIPAVTKVCQDDISVLGSDLEKVANSLYSGTLNKINTLFEKADSKTRKLIYESILPGIFELSNKNISKLEEYARLILDLRDESQVENFAYVVNHPKAALNHISKGNSFVFSTVPKKDMVDYNSLVNSELPDEREFIEFNNLGNIERRLEGDY